MLMMDVTKKEIIKIMTSLEPLNPILSRRVFDAVLRMAHIAGPFENALESQHITKQRTNAQQLE